MLLFCFCHLKQGCQIKMTGYVYFIGQVGSSAVKIGKTRGSPAKRMAQLQTGNPHLLYLKAYARLEDYDEAEKYLHKKYGRKWIAGEWFKLSRHDIWEALGELERMGGDITPCKIHGCC
jgi:hypothetical protein